MEEAEKQRLEEVIEELEKHRGRQTELISVYIPAGYNVNATQKQLEGEKGTAKNIKSTSTRKNVTDALDKIVRFLKDFKKTPENGMAVFAGNVSKVEGQQDVQLWSVEPVKPLKMRLYRCDKEFVVDALKDQLEVDEVFGLLAMDRKEATIGMLEGKRVEVFQKMTSGVPSKIRAGGQSSQRFHRITEGLTKDFYKRIAEEMKKEFYNMKKLKGILVGGPVPTKDEFLDGGYLVSKLQEKVIGRVDIGDADEQGLKELVQKSQDILSEQESIMETKLLENFFNTLGKNPEMALHKENEVRKALEMGAVDTLILSSEYVRKNKAKAKELKDLAKNISSNLETVSVETTEGEQFYNLSGVGALLRFKTGQ